jgi:hypothetical protein
VKVSVLFDAFTDWSGERQTGQGDFNERMRARGFDTKRYSAGYFWEGIGLNAPSENRGEEQDA